MEKPTYEELVQKLTSHEIEEVSFGIPGYGHYKNCHIGWIYDEYPNLGKAPRAIEVRLSSSERCLFYGPLKVGMVIFRIKGKGNLTLIDLWPKAEIYEIK